MKKEGHLQVFNLNLDVKSPLFIGSGKKYSKKEYIFEPKANNVFFLDEHKFFLFLVERSLTDAYESFMLHQKNDLWSFLQKDCHLTLADINPLIRCRMDAADALDENHSLKEIHRFIRNSAGSAYIPGSSIKGALRTVLLNAYFLKNPPQEIPECFEEAVFHTMALKKDRNDEIDKRSPLNSILQGIRIGDSLSIADNQLCLAGKYDDFVDGTYNRINLCRECVKPGTRIKAILTLDQSVLGNAITVDTLADAIAKTSAFYQERVLLHYPTGNNLMNSRTILLGGGVGFQSKTIVDTCFSDKEKALQYKAEILDRAFPKHQHKKDAEEGISPRALKQTIYKNAVYPFGICEVTMR